MTIRIQAPLLALAALVAGGAHATLRAVEESWELPLGAVVLPASEGALLVVRPCDACKTETLRTAADTRYFVRPGKDAVPLADLRKAAAKASARRAALVYVYYEPRKRAVRRLVLDAGP